MRSLCALLALGACGGTAAPRAPASSTPSPARDAGRTSASGLMPAPSELRTPLLAQANTLYMLMLDGAKPRCVQWLVEPELGSMTSHRVVAGRDVVDRIAYRTKGNLLELLDYSREYSTDNWESTSCDTTFSIKETERGLVVDSAIWFRTGEQCAEAIANRERVAMHLECEMHDRVSPKAEKSSRTRFEDVLALGGKLFTVVEGETGPRCTHVKVVPARGARDVFEGVVQHPVVRDDGVKGTQALSYEYRRGADKITFLGPGTTWKDGAVEAFG